MSFAIPTNCNMILEHAHQKLGWPEPDEIFAPQSSAPQLTADLAQQKIGRALIELSGDKAIRVGLLASSPDATEAPLALVCEFSRPASAQVLIEAQRLAWNFSRSLLLITIEPTLIRKWSCYERPKTTEELWPNSDGTPIPGQQLDNAETPQILPPIEFDPASNTFLNEEVAFSLSWIDLLTGAFFDQEAERFKIEERADRVLLDNLKAVRQRLRQLKLADEFSHDLLARIIFVQFLFDRKDSSNRAALNPDKLADLQDNNILKGHYSTLAEILSSYEDTYALFRWLNERFNGDLFPGKGATPEEREAEWKKEQENVKPEHLKLLSEFVGGELEIKKAQYFLWRQYAFDAIPLELISSIYEEFVTDAQSAHYTPGHLVDLMLDRVLPWESGDWDLKILDPSCGSGIFLVKAYQRLIYRWKRANRGQDSEKAEISPTVLRQILETNLFGVDNHRNAIRVASFSLYLAMCDEIDPRHYWSDEERVSFPALRDHTLICRDFFDEDVPGFRTKEDAGLYHLVIGNPPWGDTSLSDAAENWAEDYSWQIANKDFGVLFAAKGTELTKPNGFVCVIQSAGALLYNASGKARALQERVFNNWKKIECIVNLAVFRPFKDVLVPTCILVVSQQEPDGTPFWYECPKPLYTPEDKGRISVDFTQMHQVYPTEVLSEPWVWAALMWGSLRDRALLRKIRLYPCLEELMSTKQVVSREGINRGDRRKAQPELLGRRIFDDLDFPDDHRLSLQAAALPVNNDTFIHSKESTQLDAFESPQLLIKKSWLKGKKRFQARLVRGEQKGILCSRNYDSTHLLKLNSNILEAACLTYNSNWANYYLLLTSGRFAFDRANPLSSELRSLPLPLTQTDNANNTETAAEFRALLEADARTGMVTLEAIDDAIYRAFDFQDAERILIEDLNAHHLAEFKWRKKAPNRRHTHRKSPNEVVLMEEPDLHLYGGTLLQTLASTYGSDKAVGLRIWSETEVSEEARLPMRYVSIIFGSASHRGVSVEPLGNGELRERIVALYRHLENIRKEDGCNRQVREYTDFQESGEKVLMLNILKPDWLRYWTRSVALRDADEIARDFWLWQTGSDALMDATLQPVARG